MINYHSRIFKLPSMLLSPVYILQNSIFEEIVYLTPIYSIIPNKKICIIINSFILYKSFTFTYKLIKTIVNFISKITINIVKFTNCFYKAYQETFNENHQSLKELRNIKEIKHENKLENKNKVFNCISIYDKLENENKVIYDKWENENKVFNSIPIYDKWENESNEWASTDIY
jgi:hypothetical protein